MSRARIFSARRPAVYITEGWWVWSYTAICDSCDLFVSGPWADLVRLADTHARGCLDALDPDQCPPEVVERILNALRVAT